MSAKLTIIAATLLVAGAVSLPAKAQTPAAPAAPEATTPNTAAGPSHRLTGVAVVFNMLDRNGDGTIDMSEATTLFQSIFTTLDSNDDGKLSKDEINAALQVMHGSGPVFGRMPGRGAPQFRRGMGDGHPRIEGDGRGQDHTSQAMDGRQDGGPSGPGQMPNRLPGFNSIDTNGDGYISQLEYDAAGAQ